MRIPVVAALLVFLVSSTANGLNIAPISLGRIDASGLGEGFDFYDFHTLEIQLYTTLPVWTILNTRTTDTHFVGESNDGMVFCDLFRYISETTDYSVLNGRCHDIEDGLPLGEPLQLSWQQLSQSESSWSLMQQYLRAQWEAQMDSLSSWMRGSKYEDVVIDVMVIWSENCECARSLLGVDCNLSSRTRANMEGGVQAVILDTNVIHRNSDTGVTFSLVHMQRDSSGYRETTSSQTLTDLALPLANPELRYIQNLRHIHKADFVSFAIDIRLDAEGLGGMALGVNLGWPFPATPLPCLGYTVFSSQRMFDQDFVPAHEWGHTLGCAHDRGTQDDCDPAHKNKFYGFRSPSGTFRTVMAYPCTSGECDNYQGDGDCFAIPYWSGDASWSKTGESLGGAGNSCRDEIRKNKKAISRYRQ
ncbi:expressed unknown protein [Seminavis robusta]|uniref:Peptidase M12B domain-containing protein n=1 Tax=Seminavis robusta TaxID=568900 RepID=A0A9N8H0Q5_9STRA|nr:expressed unknown protein [Seminavis robusta]|eukprot:Sro5_g004110.1 n/a (417) ;mRNA; r:58675-60099